jgi:xanthine dehydrogenase YagS FAD-binding subunit
MRPFEYGRPNNIDEVILLLQDGSSAVRPLAGGTDLLTLMKADIVTPAQILDIKRLDDLSAAITVDDDGVTIGALATLSQIENHPMLKERYRALTEAVAQAATPQLRNRATIGGNLLQRPRCWYYRDEQFNCWLKGGDICHARDGRNELHAIMDVSPCVAVHPSDLASALVALDAEVQVRGPQGARTLTLNEFFSPPDDAHRTENVLASDELIMAVHIAAPPAGARSTYLKAMDRKVWAFALVGVAVQVVVDATQRISDARVVLGAVAPTPWRSLDAEQVLIGHMGDPNLFTRAARAALAEAKPLEHNGYKVELAQSMVRRALADLFAS